MSEISKVQISPVSVLGKTASNIEFGSATLKFGQCAISQYVLTDALGQVVLSGNVSTTPSQYAQWGTDDNQVIDFFLANLNLSRA